MKSKWELTRYLIDAKKNVDSMWFIAENTEPIKYLNLRKKSNDLRREFYINCCIVIDEYLLFKKSSKRELCENDNTINRIYYERDKNSAHKDDRYQEHDYTSLYDIKAEMEEQIIHVREVATEYLPDVVTLDFVCHDRELFRFVHKVTSDVEDEIMKKKYPLRDMFRNKKDGKVLKVFNDTEDLRKVETGHEPEYGVVVSNGLCFNEGLQERQDGCIKINVLYGGNMWCSINRAEMDKVEKLAKLGCFDEFGIIQEPPKDPILLAMINKILESPLE